MRPQVYLEWFQAQNSVDRSVAPSFSNISFLVAHAGNAELDRYQLIDAGRRKRQCLISTAHPAFPYVVHG